MSSMVVWHGTRGEFDTLLAAIGRNCSCTTGPNGVRTATCAAHQMVVEDQRAVDGLLFARRIAARLRVEEAVEDVEPLNAGVLRA